MLLSDRDIRAAVSSGRLGIEPFEDTLVQPSSVDVRLDNLFRVFNNTRYTHIDPAEQQVELGHIVTKKPDHHSGYLTSLPVSVPSLTNHTRLINQGIEKFTSCSLYTADDLASASKAEVSFAPRSDMPASTIQESRSPPWTFNTPTSP